MRNSAHHDYEGMTLQTQTFCMIGEVMTLWGEIDAWMQAAVGHLDTTARIRRLQDVLSAGGSEEEAITMLRGDRPEVDRRWGERVKQVRRGVREASGNRSDVMKAFDVARDTLFALEPIRHALAHCRSSIDSESGELCISVSFNDKVDLSPMTKEWKGWVCSPDQLNGIVGGMYEAFEIFSHVARPNNLSPSNIDIWFPPKKE